MKYQHCVSYYFSTAKSYQVSSVKDDFTGCIFFLNECFIGLCNPAEPEFRRRVSRLGFRNASELG